MSPGSKFFLFRPRMDPSSSGKANGDKLPLFTADRGEPGQDRKANFKRAWFFGAVAILFVLADQLGRVQKQTDANLAPDSTALVSLQVLSSERLGNGSGFSMRFRLSNRGNHSVFYPVSATTGAPIGQLVVRTSPASDWISSSNSANQPAPAVQELMDSNLTWIEMPPGGWLDGEFPDTSKSPLEHAYVIYVKPMRNANGIRIVSNAYASHPN